MIERRKRRERENKPTRKGSRLTNGLTTGMAFDFRAFSAVAGAKAGVGHRSYLLLRMV
jgi:hypothetical protein